MSGFALVAAVVFSTAILLSIGTIVHMIANYSDKAIAALCFQPMPRDRRMGEVRHADRA